MQDNIPGAAARFLNVGIPISKYIAKDLKLCHNLGVIQCLFHGRIIMDSFRLFIRPSGIKQDEEVVRLI
jgi:hypothetical protein